MMKRFIPPFLLVVLSLTTLHAQIAAPQLNCVRRDTLIWNTPSPFPSCGAFVGYVIYYSRNRLGPFTTLATISNRNATSFFNSGTGGNTFYYYMETSMNCPGFSPISSDTVSNQAPDLVPINVVTVTGNTAVDIRWRRSLSSQVQGYIIYKYTSAGLVPYDTVRSRDTVHYMDIRANPNTKSESYLVLALDKCGNTSLFDNPHNTINLQTTQNKCRQTLTLKWNRYKNWTTPVAKQEVWIGLNGRSPFVDTTLGPNDTMLVIPNLNDKDRYKCYIRAVQSVTNLSTVSNTVTDTINVIQPVKYVVLKNINVTNKNRVELIWAWNSNAKMDSFKVLRSVKDGNYEVIANKKPSLPLDDEYTFIDTTIDASKQSYYYKIQTKDNCDTIRSSNVAATIKLSAMPRLNLNNQLDWNPLYFPRGILVGYQVYRLENGSLNAIGLPLDTARLMFSDLVGPNDAKSCYLVTAKYRYVLPDGSTEEAESKSNLACLEQYSKIWMPNAFTPTGLNPDFRPVINFLENITTYQMSIYNRWGAKVFETNNPSEGWDGKFNGEPQAQGTFMYYITASQANGNNIETKGVVLLLR
jgi:gliding motility-associated-like protein